MDWSAILRVILAIVCIFTTECAKLNDYILDYQPLTYDKTAVHKNHERVRRSTDSQLKIRFQAYSRDFQLELSPAEGIFTPDHMVYTADKGLHYVDTSFIYEGRVKGEPMSSVHVSIHNGTIQGHVELPESRYHIEPAAKYLQSPVFHTIIYPETHLDKDPYRARREAEKHTCAVDRLREWMESSSVVEEAPSRVHKRSTYAEREDIPHNIYSEFSNRGKTSSNRVKRELGTKSACPLLMRADPLLFTHFRSLQPSSSPSADSDAVEAILAFFANHVKAISTIYSNTVFETYDKQKRNTGLSFVIRRSIVIKNCSEKGVDSGYCTNTLDVSNYLDLTSLDDHDDYCLSFTFTYRDFSGGTLGLAWVATESNVQSGVCGRHTTFTGGKKKSLNTGIVTIINFGKTVPNRVSQLTFAHEVGHNFGSPHDIGSEECAPFGTSRSDASDGNYIMYPSATSGDKSHNDDFSSCSKDNMTRIIDQVVTGKRTVCFVESNAAFCGNKITEGNETCDCGFVGECNPNSCCVGRQADVANSGCTLKPNSNCSPDSGPCCNSTCSLIQRSDNKTCAQETECAQHSICGGQGFRCPAAAHKPNGTFCSDYSKVCQNGECIAPLCKKIGWEECFLTSGTPGVSVSDLCYVSCMNPNTSKCVSSSNTEALAEVANINFKELLRNATKLRKGISSTPPDSELPVKLPPGSPCDNYRGYCDALSKCEQFDAQGPFNQLTNMIFDPVTLGKVKDWIVEHWWAVLLMAVGLVVFMGVFIKVFGYNTPSEDPKHKHQREERERQRARQAKSAQSNPKQGRPPPEPSAPYHTGVDMDMAQYGRGSYASQASNQYDRIHPGYSGHNYSHGGKNHL